MWPTADPVRCQFFSPFLESPVTVFVSRLNSWAKVSQTPVESPFTVMLPVDLVVYSHVLFEIVPVPVARLYQRANAAKPSSPLVTFCALQFQIIYGRNIIILSIRLI